jgi:hypothetical protein
MIYESLLLLRGKNSGFWREDELSPYSLLSPVPLWQIYGIGYGSPGRKVQEFIWFF